MKVVIEGPSAIGKTTLCNKLQNILHSVVLDETIIRPIENYSPYDEAIYYLNCEIERWSKSVKLSNHYDWVIFDTDPFKSLWFNWSLGYKNCLSLNELDNFWRANILENIIGFPDLYIILEANEPELLHRKQTDRTRGRENFDWISKVNPFRHNYYKFIHSIAPDGVVFLNAEVESDVLHNQVIEVIHNKEPHRLPDDLYIRIIEWLSANS